MQDNIVLTIRLCPTCANKPNPQRKLSLLLMSRLDEARVFSGFAIQHAKRRDNGRCVPTQSSLQFALRAACASARRAIGQGIQPLLSRPNLGPAAPRPRAFRGVRPVMALSLLCHFFVPSSPPSKLLPSQQRIAIRGAFSFTAFVSLTRLDVGAPRRPTDQDGPSDGSLIQNGEKVQGR